VADATDRDALDAVVARAADAGPIVGMVNLAGSILLKAAHRTTPAEFESVIAANLTTAFNTVAVAGRHLRDANIVLMSTAAAGHGFANHEAVAASKGGVEALVRSAASTYAKKGLRFNAVAPGLVDTPLAEFLTKSPPMVAASAKMHALGRIGAPQDVVGALALLLEPETTWITGQVLKVDGGLGRVQSTG
jgi:NAD(P)-dependent dehydrogenase (short-subunit alcohol dehydrogenase family)